MNTLTYAYCLVRSARAPKLPPPASAIPGAKDIRLLDAGSGLRLVVSTVPAADYNETAVAAGLSNIDWVGSRALAHEAVVESFLGAAAVLPMQLFTLFTEDARAIAHIARDRRRISRILDRVQRRHEWGLRLTFDERGAREAIDGRRGAPTSGTTYLARKRDLLDVSREQLATARAAGDRLFKKMSAAASAAVRRQSTEQTPGARLLLDAAFLVPVGRATGFRSALRRLAKALPPGVEVSLTGPWPPYNFIDVPARTRSSPRR